MTPAIDFRPMLASDLAMFREWLGRPHVAEWWDGVPSHEELMEEYAPAVPRLDVAHYIVLMDDAPIGFIQSYVAKDAGGGWWPDEQDPGVRGIDQFLANESQLGRGIGTRMVRAFGDRLFADPGVTRIQTDPSPKNGRAIRCYEKAGFRAVREVITPDGPALLMYRDRD